MKALKISKVFIDITQEDEVFAKDENGEIVEYPIEEITNKLTEAAEEGVAVNIVIKEHKKRKKSEPKKKYSYECQCSGFQSKCGELDIICNKCGNKFEVEEIWHMSYGYNHNF